MNVFVPLGLAFFTGLILGIMVSGLRVRAQLRFYRRFIEQRLDVIALPRVPIRTRRAS